MEKKVPFLPCLYCNVCIHFLEKKWTKVSDPGGSGSGIRNFWGKKLGPGVFKVRHKKNGTVPLEGRKKRGQNKLWNREKG
jgi:hypothetical protein